MSALISLISWIVSTEPDLKVRGVSPHGTSPWYCTSWQRLHLNPLKRTLWIIWHSRLLSFWPWVRVNAVVRSMLGKIRISDIKQTGQRYPCTPHPAFFPRTSWPKRVHIVWPQWLYSPWPLLWISHSSLIGPCAHSEHYATIWIVPQAEQGVGLCLLQERLWQGYLTCHYLLMDQADCDPILWALWSKAHDVRAFAASKVFQSGVSLEQILSACHWKSHNTFTQFFLKDLAWYICKWLYIYNEKIIVSQKSDMLPSGGSFLLRMGLNSSLFPLPQRRDVKNCLYITRYTRCW